MLNEFTYGGRVSLFNFFIDGSKDAFGVGQTWTTEYIDDLRQQFRQGELFGGYGYNEVKSISRHIDEHISNHVRKNIYF